MIRELAQTPRGKRQAKVAGAAPGDQPDLAAGCLTDRLRPAPVPFWVQGLEPSLVEIVDHPAHILLRAIQQMRDVRHTLAEVPRPFRTVHPLGWATWKGEFLAPTEEELLTGIQGRGREDGDRDVASDRQSS